MRSLSARSLRLDAPFLTAFLERRTTAPSGANVSANGAEPFGRPLGNASDNAATSEREVLANLSVDTTAARRLNGSSSSSSTVDVLEGGDVMLSVTVEAYPPLTGLEWSSPTPANDSAAHTLSYAADGYRLASARHLHVLAFRPLPTYFAAPV